MSLDLQLFRLINNLAGHNALLDGLMRLLVNEYFVTTTMSLILVIFWFEGQDRDQRERNQRAILRGIIALFIANIILKLCNLIYFRPRPFVDHEVNLLFYQPWDSSFPSNPATVGFSVATAMWLYNRRLGTSLLVLATLFGLSRIYCGVHYPSDVVAGALLGALSAYLVVRKGRFIDPMISLIIRTGRRLYLA
ncbi:MAG: phosphatase PAP2 family protein [Anaerolineales bacterium]|nr:phosphatase PAP2 family protein [Anaerolineales bacterium]